MFSHIDNVILTAVMKDFQPEEVARLGLVNRQFNTVSRANNYWVKWMKLHFPEQYRLNNEYGSSNWFVLFGKLYKERYVNGVNGEKITALVSNDFPAMVALKLTYNDITNEFANLKSILIWALHRSDQVLLNFLYSHVIVTTFLDVYQDRFKRTLAHWAVILRQSVEVINPLITENTFISEDNFHKRAIDYAAEYSCPTLFELFYRKRSKILELYRWDVPTPLRVSARHGHAENIDVMLARETEQDNIQQDIDYTLFDGKHNAAVVRSLLRYGANPCHYFKLHSSAINYYNAYQIALQHDRQMELTEFANQHLADEVDPWHGKSMLHFVVRTRHVEAVQKLLEMGSNANRADMRGYTALMHVMDGFQNDELRLKIIKLLMTNGAKLTVNQYGVSALSRAASFAHIDALRLMGSMGADFNLQHKNKKLIHQVIGDFKHNSCHHLPELLLTLMELGADLTAKTTKGYTAVNCAVQVLTINTLLVLFDLDKKNLFKLTDLHKLAIHGKGETVEQLCARGSFIDETDYSGLTPLCYAVIYGNEQIVMELLAKSAVVNFVAPDGMTPLHFAVYNHRPNKIIIDALLARGAYIHATSDVVKASPLMIADSYNLVDDEDKIKAIRTNFNTLFVMNEISKIFTSSAVIQLVMQYLFPEDICALALINNNVRRMVESANTIWKMKMQLHFPQHMPSVARHANTKWYDLFKRTYRSTYFIGLQDPNRKLNRRRLSAVKENQIEELLTGISFDELVAVRDTHQMSIFDWLRYYKRQALLDRIYIDGWLPICLGRDIQGIRCYQPVSALVREFHGVGFQDAARYGHLTFTKWLIENYNYKESDIRTAYKYAAIHGHIEILRYLQTQRYASIQDWTTYSEVMSRGHTEVMRFMLETMIIGFTIGINLDMFKHGHFETAHVVWEYRDRTTLWSDKNINSFFLTAVLEQKNEIIDFILGKDINYRAALEYALAQGCNAAVQILLPYKMDTFSIMLDNIFAKHWGAVGILNDAGVSLDVCDDYGHTYLMTACHHGDTAVVEKLLSYKVIRDNIDKKDRDGNTALMWAAYQGSDVNVQALLNVGANFFKQNRREDALKISIQRGHDLVTKILLQKKLEDFKEGYLSSSVNVISFWGHSRQQQFAAIEALSQLLDKIYDRGLGQHSLIQELVLNLHDLNEHLDLFSQGKLADFLNIIIELDVNATMTSRSLRGAFFATWQSSP